VRQAASALLTRADLGIFCLVGSLVVLMLNRVSDSYDLIER
jgi:hypothetical protein